MNAGFLVCMEDEAKMTNMAACPEGDDGCSMQICFPECPSGMQDLLDCGHDECPDDEADLIELSQNLNCEDPSRFEGPPACVADCDWSTGCPDPAACDTSACPTVPTEGYDGDNFKEGIDAYLAAGCQEKVSCQDLAQIVGQPRQY